jgi:hypothetical protein
MNVVPDVYLMSMEDGCLMVGQIKRFKGFDNTAGTGFKADGPLSLQYQYGTG